MIRFLRIDRWVWPWFPDLKRLDTEPDRWELWRAAYYPVGRSKAYIATAITIQVGAQIVLGIPAVRYVRSHGYYNTFALWGIPTVIAVLAVLATLWLARRLITRSLRRQLNQRGLPTCLPCGYDLTGNVSGVCPECGSACQQHDTSTTESIDA